MRGVILAAGSGSRMGSETDDVPKALLEVGGRTLYDRQREALADHVDGVTVVLGYEAENARERIDEIEDRRADDASSPYWSDGSSNRRGPTDVVVFDRWDEYDNAESLRRALDRVEDDALVLNGDVLVARRALDLLVGRFEARDGAYNVVGCLPGVQSDHTAIRYDDEGFVVAYGDIPGHRHAGVGVVSSRHRDEAMDVLARNRDDWYPRVYPETPTKRVVVPPDDHLEINRPNDLEGARERLPLEPRIESDALSQ